MRPFRVGPLLLLIAAAPAAAAPIGAGTTVIPSRAIQTITLFNPSGGAEFPNVSGVGQLTLTRGPQVGNTIPITGLTGLYFGSHPVLGDYVFGSVAPLTAANFSGTITNVVQDPNDPGFASGSPSSFRSGTLTFGGNSFGFTFLSGPNAGATLFTDPTVPFQFTAALDGLPPSPGTVLQNSGPATLDVLLGSQVVATSSERRIVVLAVPVPEPSTLAVLGVVGLGGAVWRRGRRPAGVA